MFLAVCAIVMLVLMLLRCRLYGVRMITVFPLMMCVAYMGLLGTRIMFFIENGGWYGKSFFGAVLFFPILLLPVAWLFRMRLRTLLDYATIPGIGMLAIFKWNCYTDGCCGGKVLWYSEAGIPTYFPSQLVEMGTAIALVIILLILERKPKCRGKIYPLCLILYGLVRYVLNGFRWEQTDFLFGMTAGNLWSLVSIGLGIVSLHTRENYFDIIWRRKNERTDSDCS